SCESIFLPANISLNRRNIIIGSNFIRTVRAHVSNVRMVLQPHQHSHRYPISGSVDVIERKFQLSTLCRHFAGMRLGRLLELNDDAHSAISIQREISEIAGELLMTGFVVLCSSRSWSQNEDRHR